MKNIFLTLSFAVLTTTLGIGQHKVANDPQYSVHNYKHPDKAAYAKKHKMDKDITIVSGTGKRNDNYKQSFKKPENGEKVTVKTRSRDKKNRSYKHPYGF